MGKTTGISWTDHTFNPWWGCEKVSPACAHCYAETLAGRFGTEWGKDAPRRFFGDKHWSEPLAWNAAAARDGVRRKVFCASMADVLEDRKDLVAPRRRLWELVLKTPHLDWLILSKRPENFAWLDGGPWPKNIWAGTTVENQEWAERRIPHLLACGALVKFVSAEPLLGFLDLDRVNVRAPIANVGRGVLNAFTGELTDYNTGCVSQETGELSWVIVGGESGKGWRPLDEGAVRSLERQCRVHGAAFFYKQGAGERPDKAPLLDGVRHAAFPVFGE